MSIFLHVADMNANKNIIAQENIFHAFAVAIRFVNASMKIFLIKAESACCAESE
jgi:hypothetical protein